MSLYVNGKTPLLILGIGDAVQEKYQPKILSDEGAVMTNVSLITLHSCVTLLVVSFSSPALLPVLIVQLR